MPGQLAVDEQQSSCASSLCYQINFAQLSNGVPAVSSRTNGQVDGGGALGCFLVADAHE